MKNKVLKILFLVLFLIGINTTVSKAAISASSKTVNSGEHVSISIYSNVPVVSYKVTMTNAGGLTFVNSSGGTGAGTTTITDAKATGMTSLATYTFKVPKVSKDTTYKVSFTATIMEDENFNPVPNSTSTATITVKAPKPITPPPTTNSGSNTKPKPEPEPEIKKSTDSTLKSLVIEGYELYPVFNTATKEYNLKVTNDITSVKIIPKVNDSKASYKIDGEYQNLVVGKNMINIVVTAEDGTTSTYVLTITREREALAIQQIKISYVDGEGNTKELALTPEFIEDIYEYSLENVSYLVSKLDVEVLTNLETAKIEITGNEGLKEGENIITITVTMPSESEEELDEVLEYTIKVNKEVEPTVTLMGRIQNWFNGIAGTIGTWYTTNQYKIIMSALVLCIVSLIGLSIYIVIDYKKYRMIVAKVAEITKINNASVRASETVVTSDSINLDNIENENNEKLEESKLMDVEEPKAKGRHF